MVRRLKLPALALVAALAALLVAELVVAPLAPPMVTEPKTGFDGGHCYPSPTADGLPLDLRRDDSALRARGVDPGEIKRLKELVPHCVIYDLAARSAGYFPEREEDVFLVGDSFAFGEGLAEADTLGRLLAEALPRFNVRTLARPAANVEDVLAQTRRAVEELGARRLVYLFNLNDIDPTGRAAMDERLARLRSNPEADSEPGPYEACAGMFGLDLCTDMENAGWYLPRGQDHPDAWSPARTHLGRLLLQWWVTRGTVARYLEWYTAPAHATRAARVLAAITTMARLAERAGARFLLVVHPLLYRDPLGGYPFAPIHRLILAHCRAQSIECADGLEAFPEDGSLRRFWVHAVDQHPGRQANLLTARFIAALLTTERGT